MTRPEADDPLAHGPFSYQATADGRVHIFYRNRRARILKGQEAARFLDRIATSDPAARQQVMAKATGQFKLGNERSGRGKRP
jgi:hypothetical protein